MKENEELNHELISFLNEGSFESLISRNDIIEKIDFGNKMGIRPKVHLEEVSKALNEFRNEVNRRLYLKGHIAK